MNAEPRRVVMATGNKAKLAEIRPLLDGSGIVVCAQSEFDFRPADETGQTFHENALLKARAAATATGLIAIADDSGLCVDALDGRPGVHSARFAGANATDADNVDKLLQQMQAVDDDRGLDIRRATDLSVELTFRHGRDPLSRDHAGHRQHRIPSADH